MNLFTAFNYKVYTAISKACSGGVKYTISTGVRIGLVSKPASCGTYEITFVAPASFTTFLPEWLTSVKQLTSNCPGPAF